MGISLPNPRNVFVPVPPPITTKNTGDVIRYLNRLKDFLGKEFANAFDNTYSILSTGTSCIIDSTTNTITVVNGIITGIS